MTTIDATPTADAEPTAGSPPPTNPVVERDLPVTLIERRPGWQFVNVREMWRSREVLYYLSWRDIKVRYKQTALGIAWAFAQPLFAMVVFTIFLGKLGGLAEGNENYALYVFAGMLPWTFLSSAVGQAGNSLVANERLITKAYFPRLLVPFSSVGSVLFDFVIALPLLAILVACFGVAPGWSLLMTPVIVILLIMFTMGAGALLSALIAVQRDFRYVMHFGIQVWMFATPAIYRPVSPTGAAATWLPFNPAHGLIENFRLSVTGGELNWYSLGVSTAVSVVITVIGLAYFRRMERSFADVL